MSAKHCMDCFFFRIVNKREICCRGYDLDRTKWNHADSCKDYREDKTFTRLQYPEGVTPEEAKENKRAAVLAALKEVESE